MKIALVHDYLNEAGGAERVLMVLVEMLPTAPIHVAFMKEGSAKAMFKDRVIIESPWGWLLKIGRLYSYLRFCLPLVWRSLDLREYDLIITSCSGYIARGFRVKEGAKVIAYCHTPPRWLYGYETPTGAQAKWWGKVFMFVIGPFVRYFDYVSAQRVDEWVANSKEVAERISKFYRKEAQVVYPPIETKLVEKEGGVGDYYLLVSRIVGGKGIEETVRVARKLKIKLRIVGEMVGGIKREQIEGGGVTYLGRVDDKELASLYSRARGLIALAKDEDFGMTLVEAMSYGTPVLAYYGGGYKETVVEGKTGVFVREVNEKSLAAAIKEMEQTKWKREEIKKWVKRFKRSNFEQQIKKILAKYV